jgi:hypothetical protein
MCEMTTKNYFFMFIKSESRIFPGDYGDKSSSCDALIPTQTEWQWLCPRAHTTENFDYLLALPMQIYNS